MGATDETTVDEHNRAAMARWAGQLEELLAVAVSDPLEHRVLADLEFAQPDGHTLLLDLYLPARPTGPAPVLIWVHGGAWMTGDRSQVPSFAGRFAGRGIAVASIEYRLSGVATFPAPLLDVRAAVRWVRENAAAHDLDAGAVALGGGSAGAHLAALAALTARDALDRVQAVVDGYGPTTLADMDAQRGPDDVIHSAPGSAEARLLGVGAIADASAQQLAAADPIAHITADAPPFLIVHGTDDVLVPPGQSIALHEALVDAGVESTLCLIDDAYHGMLRGETLNRRPAPQAEIRTNAGGGERTSRGPVTFELIERFLDRHLRRDPWSAL